MKHTFSFKEINYGSISIEAGNAPDESDVESEIMKGNAYIDNTYHEDIELTEAEREKANPARKRGYGRQGMKMDHNNKAYDKLSAEFNAFKEELIRMPNEETLKHAYEFAWKDEIVLTFEGSSMNLTPRQAKAVLAEKHPLDYLYREWIKTDCSHLDSLRDCIKDGIAALEKDCKHKSMGAR